MMLVFNVQKDMMERLDSANIVLLKHTTAKSAKERIEGFLSVIDNNEKYKVINEAECDGQLEIAMPKMQEIIEETPDIDVVMALNDPSALGALAALEKNNKNDVMVYGIDGTPEIKSFDWQKSNDSRYGSAITYQDGANSCRKICIIF